MASLSDYGKDVANVLNRQGSVFLREHNGGSPQFVNLGRVQESSVTEEAVTSEQDQDGRTSTQLLEMTASFTLQQTSNLELSTLPDLARPDTSLSTYSNGHAIYFAGTNQISTSDVNNNLTTSSDLPDYTVFGDTSSEPSDPNGRVFVNVLLNPSPEINFSGEQGIIPIEFMARYRPEEYDGFDDENSEDGNHIVVSPE